jgi:hypothetical protein
MVTRPIHLLALGAAGLAILVASRQAFSASLDECAVVNCGSSFVIITTCVFVAVTLLLLARHFAWRSYAPTSIPTCPVCDHPLTRCGWYCPECGSRVDEVVA